ncbi:MAG TPA: hypothetical protein VKU94_00960 [Geobacterales bacterium]|nr:hypothetical protein [Geobacterales bacterium]
MDRAIIEILNTVALLCISALLISLSSNIYFFYYYSDHSLEFNLIYYKIKNILQKIYYDGQKYNKNENITLILNKYVYLRGNGTNILIISYYGINETMPSPLNVYGTVSSNIVVFQYVNGIVYITKPSPLYIPPNIVR